MSHKICRVAHDKIFIWKNMSWNLSCATRQTCHVAHDKVFLSNVCRVAHDTVVCILVESYFQLYSFWFVVNEYSQSVWFVVTRFSVYSWFAHEMLFWSMPKSEWLFLLQMCVFISSQGSYSTGVLDTVCLRYIICLDTLCITSELKCVGFHSQDSKLIFIGKWNKPVFF